MGIFGSFFGAIGSVLGAIGGALSSALSVLGGPILGVFGGIISSVISALTGDKEDPEELGEKVLQAEEAGLGKADDESFLDAKKRFDEFEIDPDKKHNQDDVMRAGLGIQIQCAKENKFDITDFAVGVAKLGQCGLLDEKSAGIIKQLGKIASPEELNDIGKMFAGSLESHDAIDRCLDKLAEAVKAENPTMTDNDAYAEALKYRL